MQTKRFILSFMLLSIVVISGCWNSKELSHLAIVSAIGIDKIPENQQYRVSFQVINPSEISSGTQGGGGGRTTPVSVFTETGNTFFEIIRKASRKVPRELFFSHVRMLVLSEQLARDGIEDLFDVFERVHQIRLTTKVVVARGSSAESVLGIVTPTEKIIANSTAGKLRLSSKLYSESIELSIDDIIRALVSKGREPVITGIKIFGDIKEGTNKKNVEKTEPDATTGTRGIAMFKDGRLQRWLDGTEARGVLRIQNKMKSTIEVLDCEDKKNVIAIELSRSKTDVKVEVRNGRPVFHISIMEEGKITEAKCAIDLTKIEEFTKLELQWNDKTKREVTASVKAAQREGCDIFGFGEVLNRANAKEWKKVMSDWNSLFAQSEVVISVNSFIRNSGMQSKPYLLQENK